MKMYKGKIKFVFKQLPLGFHKYAMPAAIASIAAHKQGKFWPYHDLLFANQSKLSEGRALFLRLAKQVGLDLKKFQADLDDPSTKAQVENDMFEADGVGASGTPSFFVNGKKAGNSLKALQKAINEALLAKGFKKSDLPKGPPPVVLKLGNAPYKGGKHAKVTIVEFSDFQCPYCSMAAKVLNKVAKLYGNKIKLVFKHYPLPFHKQAHLAAQASLAAHEQGKFWEYHDLLFANQRKLQKADLLKYARQLSMDMQMFKQALDSGKFKGQVDADMQLGTQAGVSGTPSLYINNTPYKGSITFKGLREVLNPLLIKAGVPAESLPKAPPTKVPLHGTEPFKGGAKAKVTIVEFSDFQCPFCQRAAKTIKQVVKTYGDKIKLVFKHYPLPFHKQAPLAHQAAIAAQAQGKFWAYHDLLFANQRKLQKADLLKYAKQLGMDMAQFKKALDSQTYKGIVDADIQVGKSVGVNGTPAFFINGKLISGAQPFSTFKQAIDAALKAVAKKAASCAPSKGKDGSCRQR